MCLTWIIGMRSNIFADTLPLASPACPPNRTTGRFIMRISGPMTIDQTESPTANPYRCDRTRPVVR